MGINTLLFFFKKKWAPPSPDWIEPSTVSCRRHCMCQQWVGSLLSHQGTRSTILTDRGLHLLEAWHESATRATLQHDTSYVFVWRAGVYHVNECERSNAINTSFHIENKTKTYHHNYYDNASFHVTDNTGVPILPIQVPQELHQKEKSQEIEMDQGVPEGRGQGDVGGERTSCTLPKHCCISSQQWVVEDSPRPKASRWFHFTAVPVALCDVAGVAGSVLIFTSVL